MAYRLLEYEIPTEVGNTVKILLRLEQYIKPQALYKFLAHSNLAEASLCNFPHLSIPKTTKCLKTQTHSGSIR